MQPTQFYVLVLICFISVFDNLVFSQPNPTIICNEFLTIWVDENCEKLITADELLEGNDINPSDFVIDLFDKYGNGIDNPVSGSYSGDTITAVVTELATNDNCMASVYLKDGLPPLLNCPAVELACFDHPNTAPLPTITDNCDPIPNLFLIDEMLDDADFCNGIYLYRTYVGADATGNISMPCQQIIQINSAPNIYFPQSIIYNCADVAADSSLLLPSITGLPNVALGDYCPYTIGMDETILSTCGNSFTIYRAFSVMNWCTGEVIAVDQNGNAGEQIIEVMDNTPPTIELAPYEVNADLAATNQSPCKSIAYLQPPIVFEDCNDYDVSIFTPIGEAIYTGTDMGASGGFIPAPGLDLGVHDIIYTAIDACGNSSEWIVPITVVDAIKPTAICQSDVTIFLNANGNSTVAAALFDDGSSDNCCVENLEVRRLNGGCASGSNNLFGPTVSFCCEDLQNPIIPIVLKVSDCFGNIDNCVTQVVVNENLMPTVENCPSDTLIYCDFFKENLEIPALNSELEIFDNLFGLPVFTDNCGIIEPEAAVNYLVDECYEGTINRTWTVTNANGDHEIICQQNIVVSHLSDWVVEFPADETLDCSEVLISVNEPIIFSQTCEIIATSFEDFHLSSDSSACFAILRNWMVINWCIVNDDFSNNVAEDAETLLNIDLNEQNGVSNRTFQDGLNASNYDAAAPNKGATPDGIIKYDQMLYVNDQEPPDFTCPVLPPFCIVDDDCDKTVVLPLPAAIDCSGEVEMLIFTDYGNDNTLLNVPIGFHQVAYMASDNCGNTNSCQTILEVRDCSAPYANCVNGLLLELDADGEAVLFAPDLNSGSFDNCSASLSFSFSPDITNNTLIFDCNDQGLEALVETYVTDAAGNQDLCETAIFVDYNSGVCEGSFSVAGSVQTSLGLPVGGVSIAKTGDNASVLTTDDDGQFIFENIASGSNFSLIPEKDYFHLNGVSTFDLVLINQHILGTEILSDPYTIIAADANQSNSITTLDLVQIRRLVLLIDDAFQNSPSWRIFDKNHIFQDPSNPFSDMPDEVMNFTDIDQNINNADWIAVKVGDVNHSVQTLQLTGVDDRNFEETFSLSVENQIFTKDEIIEVNFETTEKNILGYQFALDFDKTSLQLLEVKEGLAIAENFGLSKLDKGVITTSWNGEIQSTEQEKILLFRAIFSAKKSGQLQEALSLNNADLSAEAYSKNRQIMDVELSFYETVQPFIVYQNSPNPFGERTTISMDLNKNSTINWQILDMAGKLILTGTKEGRTGANTIEIIGQNLGESGIYLYQIQAEDVNYTGKMMYIHSL